MGRELRAGSRRFALVTAFKRRVSVCGLSAASFGRFPAGRGAGGAPVFSPPEMFNVAVSLPVFQLSRPEGGLAALPGTRRDRGGGLDGGRRGKGGPAATRAQASEVAAGPLVQQTRNKHHGSP